MLLRKNDGIDPQKRLGKTINGTVFVYRCSFCGTVAVNEKMAAAFCPACGRRMRRLVPLKKADDMEHVYFKMNDETHRGISDLHKALFPATLYSAMYITNCIWTMTRSQDKRVYYVKQTVDTNISKTLLNTINQIKKGNMNIRQIENINHILNIF